MPHFTHSNLDIMHCKISSVCTNLLYKLKQNGEVLLKIVCPSRRSGHNTSTRSNMSLPNTHKCQNHIVISSMPADSDHNPSLLASEVQKLLYHRGVCQCADVTQRVFLPTPHNTAVSTQHASSQSTLCFCKFSHTSKNEFTWEAASQSTR